MDKDLIKSMLLKAKDQYEGAIRWAFIAILVGAIFHLITFSQYLSLSKKAALLEASADELNHLSPTLEAVAENLRRIDGSGEGTLSSRFETELGGLEADFQSLSETIHQIRTSSEPSTPESILQPNFAIQVPIEEPAGSIQEYFDIEPALEQAIREAKDDELIEILRPLIEEEIIQPRFAALNTFWQDGILADLRENIPPVVEVLESQELELTGDPSRLSALAGSLKQTLSFAEQVVFQPPSENPEWWESVTSKRTTLEAIENATIESVEAATSLEALVTVLDQVDETRRQQAALLDDLQNDIKNLEVQFQQQQDKLDALGTPFEFLAMDLVFMVSIFPLMLGVLLAAALAWPAYRLRELAWAVDELANIESDSRPRTWFSRRSGLSIQAPGESPLEGGKLLWRTNRNWLVTHITLVLLFCAWVWLAAWQLIGWQQADAQRTILTALGGCFLVLLAGGYRWYIAGQVVTEAGANHSSNKNVASA